MQRRNFIQHGALAALGTLALPNTLLESKKIKEIGIQLYTLRDLIKEDAVGTITKVAKIGYNFVETHDYRDGKLYGMPIVAFKKMIDGLGLKTHSSHIGLELFRNNIQQVLTDAKALGQTYVICPSLPKKDRTTIDQYKKIAEEFNQFGEAAKKMGLTFAYHNHAFEFEAMEGQMPYDVLLQNTDAELVKMEMDLYWTIRGGQDPVAYFKKYPGRTHLWHVKDMANTAEKEFASVGSGFIDFKTLFANAKLAGAKYFVVEQDSHKNGQPIENITNSYNYLKALKY